MDRKWNLFHRHLAREYPRKSAKQINRIEAGIKRKRGWKPRKQRKR